MIKRLLELLREIPGERAAQRVSQTTVGKPIDLTEGSVTDQIEVTCVLDDTATVLTMSEHHLANCGHIIRNTGELAGVCASCAGYVCQRQECGAVCPGCARLFCTSHLGEVLGSHGQKLCQACGSRCFWRTLLGLP